MGSATQVIETDVPESTGYFASDCEGKGTFEKVKLVLPDSLLPARFRFDHIWTDEELIRFGNANPLVRFEQEPDGDVTVMSPTGSQGTEHETDLILELGIWARTDGRGRVYNSNGGFRLPDGSMRVPDAAWVSWERIRALPKDRTKGFYPICPEFIVEVRSETDSLTKLRDKMQQWIANGCELAWLLDPSRNAVEIYRPGQQPEIWEGQSAVYGEGPVAGFVLELGRVWVRQLPLK